ncbi:transposase [Paraburkholderia aspalathi]|uniref:transposase n=1 Tax=Paraburkholderia aspalathi TaxID=1324617 RepID=UPI003C7FB9F4
MFTGFPCVESEAGYSLTDDEWTRVRHLFPERASTRGRPPKDVRPILDAILWVCRTGEKWHRLPPGFASQQTCYLKYMAWKNNGTLQAVLDILEIQPVCT